MGAWRRSDPGAVPFGEHREVARALPSWKGKTVIDAMNMLVPLEELA
jgi:predicted dinucleotide-binding enzyme